MAEDVKQEMNSTPGCIPSKWTRNTVADGDWLQKYTIAPLSSRDDFLADKISAAELNIDEEIEARKAGDAYLSANLTGFSAEYFEFKDNVETSAENLSAALQEEIVRAKNAETNLDSRINTERTDRINEDAKLQSQLDTLKAATDVIDVWGTYDSFSSNSATKYFPVDEAPLITNNDIIKILNDEVSSPVNHQSYWQCTFPEHQDPTSSNCTWSFIGYVDPYYNTTEIDEKFDDLSYVSSISADETEVGFDFHKGDGTLTTFKLKEGPNIVFTPGTNDLTISALPGTKTYNIVDTSYENDMFWGNDNYNAAYKFLRSGDSDWGTMDEIIDCFNNNIPVYINEYNEVDTDNYSNYTWKLNTIKTFTADNKKHIKFTFENEHDETNYYGYIEWQEGAYAPVVYSQSGYSKASLFHDTNLSGDGTETNELGLNSAVNVYVPAVQGQNTSANVQIGYTPNNLPYNALYQRDYVGVALNRNYGLDNDIGFQLDENGLHLNSLYAPDASTITSYATHFTHNEYFNLYSAYWNTHYKNITAFDNNGSEEPIRLNELKLSAGKGLSFTMTDYSNWSGPATWAPPGVTVPNVSGYTKLSLSINDSIITSAEHGQEAYENLGAAKISANSSPAFTGLLSAGFRISAGNNLTITTASNNTIQLNAKPTGLTSISAGGNGNVNKNYTDNLSLSATSPVKFVTAANNVLGVGVESATLQAGQGISFYNAGSNRLGISVNYSTATENSTTYVTALNNIPLSAGMKYENGNYIEVNNSTKKINLSSNIIVEYMSATSALLSADYTGGTYWNYLTPSSIRFAYGFGSTILSQSGVDLSDRTTTKHIPWTKLINDYVLTTGNASGSKLSANTAITLVVTSRLPNVLEPDTYYIV